MFANNFRIWASERSWRITPILLYPNLLVLRTTLNCLFKIWLLNIKNLLRDISDKLKILNFDVRKFSVISLVKTKNIAFIPVTCNKVVGGSSLSLWSSLFENKQLFIFSIIKRNQNFRCQSYTMGNSPKTKRKLKELLSKNELILYNNNSVID